jgi:hypothetical protein
MKKFLIAVCSIILVIGAVDALAKPRWAKARLHLRSLRGADRTDRPFAIGSQSARMVESGGKLLRLAAFLVRI